jgi:ribosome-associated translation inhibitor RaiA
MASEATVVVHFKDVEHTDELRETIEKRCQHLAEEFSETTRFEVSLSQDGKEITAHTRASGKNTDVAAHASAPEERQAADAALHRLERELRSRHDKRIFSPRREAKRAKEAEKAG